MTTVIRHVVFLASALHASIAARVSEAKVLEELEPLTLAPTQMDFCEKIIGQSLEEQHSWLCDWRKYQYMPKELAEECAKRVVLCQHEWQKWKKSKESLEKVGMSGTGVASNIGKEPNCHAISVTPEVDPIPFGYYDCSESSQLNNYMTATCSRNGAIIRLNIESITYSNEEGVKSTSSPLFTEVMTVEAAKMECAKVSLGLATSQTSCMGFVFQGNANTQEAIEIHFIGSEKSMFNYRKNFGGAGWTSFYATRRMTTFHEHRKWSPVGTLEPTDMEVEIPGMLGPPATVRLLGDEPSVSVVVDKKSEVRCKRSVWRRFDNQS